MGSWGEIYHIPISATLSPPKNTAMLPCHHIPFFPSGVWRNQTWSLCSCRWRGWIGTRGSLFTCLPSFGGSHPCLHGTPLLAVGGIKRVYKCQVEGCSEGHQPHMLPSVHTCTETIWGWGWCVPPTLRLSWTWMPLGITGKFKVTSVISTYIVSYTAAKFVVFHLCLRLLHVFCLLICKSCRGSRQPVFMFFLC